MLYEQHQLSGSVLIADKGKVVYKKEWGIRGEGACEHGDGL